MRAASLLWPPLPRGSGVLRGLLRPALSSGAGTMYPAPYAREPVAGRRRLPHFRPGRRQQASHVPRVCIPEFCRPARAARDRACRRPSFSCPRACAPRASALREAPGARPPHRGNVPASLPVRASLLYPQNHHCSTDRILRRRRPWILTSLRIHARRSFHRWPLPAFPRGRTCRAATGGRIRAAVLAFGPLRRTKLRIFAQPRKRKLKPGRGKTAAGNQAAAVPAARPV